MANGNQLERITQKQQVLRVRQKQAQLAQPPSTTAQDIGEAAIAGVRGAVSGATFGLSLEAEADIRARQRAGEEGLQPGSPRFGPNPAFEQRVAELTPAFRQVIEEEQARAPIAATVGEIAGLVTPAGPAGALARAGGAAVRATRAGRAAAELPVVGRVAGPAVQAVGEEAALSAAEVATGKVTPEEAITRLPLAAGAGAILPAAGIAFRGVTRGIKEIGIGTLATITGTRRKSIKELFKRADEVVDVEDIDIIKEKAKNAIEKLRSSKEETIQEIAVEVSESIDQASQALSNQSSEAFDILSKSGKTFKLQDVLSSMNRASKALTGRSGLAVSNARSKLKNFVDDVQATKAVDDNGEITAVQLKEIIQDLDSEIGEVSIAMGGKPTRTESTLFAARKNIDNFLKSPKTGVPKYAEIMSSVSSQTRWIKEISKELGTPKKVLSAVERAGKPIKSEADRKLLDIAAKNNISLDRVQKAKEVTDFFQSWNDLNFSDRFGRLVSRTTEQNKKILLTLENVSDTKFAAMADRLRLLSEFDQELLRASSENVNLWTFLTAGSLLGLGGGATGVGFGGAGGAMLGIMIRRFGPRTAKNMILGVAKIKGIPTVRKINNLIDIPPEGRKFLADSFKRSFTREDENPVEIPLEKRAEMRREIEISDSITNIEKAQMLRDLNDTSRVKNIDKLIFSGEKIEPKTPERFFRKKSTPVRRMDEVTDFVENRRESEI